MENDFENQLKMKIDQLGCCFGCRYMRFIEELPDHVLPDEKLTMIEKRFIMERLREAMDSPTIDRYNHYMETRNRKTKLPGSDTYTSSFDAFIDGAENQQLEKHRSVNAFCIYSQYLERITNELQLR